MSNNSNLKKAVYKNYFTMKVQKENSTFVLSQFLNWSRLMQKRIYKWLPENKYSKILDLGTGTGNFLIMMDALGYKNLTGIDTSEEQIKIAKSLSANIIFVKVNIIEYLENNVEKFDLISLIDVIEHFERDEAFYLLNLVNHTLNSEGRIIIQTPNALSPWMGAVCYGDLTHEWFYTPNSLDDLLIQCGFHKSESIEIAPIPTGKKELLRLMLWRTLKIFYKIINLIEIGSSGKDQIYSRVFISTAIKKN